MPAKKTPFRATAPPPKKDRDGEEEAPATDAVPAEEETPEEAEGPDGNQPLTPPISDQYLGDWVDVLDRIPVYLRCISLSIRGLYESTKNSDCEHLLPVFAELQDSFVDAAQIFNVCLVPLTMTLIFQLSKFLGDYLEHRFEVWNVEIDACARRVKEFKVLFECTAKFFETLEKELEWVPGKVKEVRESLVTETIKFQRESGILDIKSYIEDDVALSLLFVPDVHPYAEPMVHGGRKNEFRKPVVAKSFFDCAFAASNAIECSLLPSTRKLRDALFWSSTFLQHFLAEMESTLEADSTPLPPPKKRDPWEHAGKTKEEIQAMREAEEAAEAEAQKLKRPPEEQKALEAKRLVHYELVKPKAYWLDRSWRSLLAVSGSITRDMSNIPFSDPEDKPVEWLESRQQEDGQDIVDIARAATKNVEITAALDP